MSEFWSGAAANTIGSIVGVVIGVPIALWIERRRQREADAKHSADVMARRRAIVVQLVRSLDSNIEAVQGIWSQVAKTATCLAPQLDASVWRTFRRDLDDLPVDLLYDVGVVFRRVEEIPPALARYEDLFLTAAAALPSADLTRAAVRDVVLDICDRFIPVATVVRRRLTEYVK